LSELIDLNPEMKMNAVIRSGMNIGRDIMGTMANTLILAYVGGSLNTIMLLLTYQNSLPQMLNLEMIATEVLKSVGGSIGILFTIPITAVITAVMHHKKKA
ncbi:MAG: YibE/F family protein, partial [Oscillospiraceae bacterium]|nr:YibE/F family protein [Oscillospiraceae bacterium]